MSEISLKDLDEIRKAGLRPTVVGCFVNNKKALLVFHEEYNLWQFPQGGVDNGETLETVLKREMREEMGEDLIMYASEAPTYIGFDQITFKENKHGSRRLETDDGEKIRMIGKSYLFFVIKIPIEHLDMEPSEFDKYKWVDYEKALATAETIYQPGKQRITKKALELLKDQKFID